MSINATIQGLEPGQFVQLFELDCREIGGDLQRFHGYPQQGPIWWQGVEYQPWAIEADGFAITGSGSQPTPRLRVGNIGQDQYGLPISGVISALCIALEDLVGARVIRHRTFAEFLDARNFPEGNPAADPAQEFPPDIWLIECKLSENSATVEFELRTALDFEGQKLPARQITPNCGWVVIGGYRGPYCGYTGPLMFDLMDQPTADPTLDRCAGRMQSCKLRFGEFEELPFGGFPGADAIRGY